MKSLNQKMTPPFDVNEYAASKSSWRKKKDPGASQAPCQSSFLMYEDVLRNTKGRQYQQEGLNGATGRVESFALAWL